MQPALADDNLVWSASVGMLAAVDISGGKIDQKLPLGPEGLVEGVLHNGLRWTAAAMASLLRGNILTGITMYVLR